MIPGGAEKLLLQFTEVVLTGPCGLSLPLPKFEQLDIPHNEKFILRDHATARPLADLDYKIELADGKTIEGVTNAQGQTSVSPADVAQGMKLLFTKMKGD